MHESLMLGLTSALCLGVGDYLARGVTHRVGWKRTLLWLQLASVLPLVAIGLASGGMVPMRVELVMMVAVLGTLNFVGAVGLYRAFATGVLSVVSPIASTFAVITVALAMLAGRAPTGTVLAGLAVTLVGLGAASVAPSDGTARGRGPGAGVGWALVSSVGFGATFFVMDGVAAELGPVWPVVGMRIVAITLTATTLARWPEATPVRLPWARIAAVAALDSAGIVAFTAGTLAGNVAIVSVLASSFAAVTVVIAQIRLRERLAPWQWAGIAAIVAGIALTTYYSEVG